MPTLFEAEEEFYLQLGEIDGWGFVDGREDWEPGSGVDDFREVQMHRRQ